MTVYRWRVHTRLPDRFGTLCHVLIRGGMNSCLVEFIADGYKVLTSRNYLRRDVAGNVSDNNLKSHAPIPPRSP